MALKGSYGSFGGSHGPHRGSDGPLRILYGLLRGSCGPQEVNMGSSGATIGYSKACMSNLEVYNPTQEWIWNIGGSNESIRVLCGPFQGSNWVFKG